ncbi:hypothetical protein VST7929_01425 [Vibrio stylophorae]|uniref:Lipoprotein n=1 Tax=Vibrio stylophorae TaxID=659351 RepID=A0ABN8DRY5_9VIBR|nr:hypothetical protein [Vibrio stylophorae]CAH0533555.1 hypothetical protein VST7929_01425 [Vibrio stylophorae]
MKKTKLLPLAAALLLVGCGDNAKIDLKGEIPPALSQDYSVFTARSLTVEQAQNTIFNPDFVKSQLTLLGQVEDLLDNVPSKIADDAAWVTKAEALQKQIKAANMGEFGTDINTLMSAAISKVKSRQPVIQEVTNDESMMQYLAKTQKRTYTRFIEAKQKLAEFGTYGKAEYEAAVAAQNTYRQASRKLNYGLKETYVAALAKYVTEKSIPIRANDIPAYIALRYSSNDACDAANELRSPTTKECYYYEFKSFSSKDLAKLTEAQIAEVNAIGQAMVPELIAAFNADENAEKALEVAREANNNVTIISENKYGMSYATATKRYNSAVSDLARYSNQLINPETLKINTESKGYQSYIDNALRARELNTYALRNSISNGLRKIDMRQLQQVWVDGVKHNTTEVELSDEGEFSIEGNVYLLLSGPADYNELSYIGQANVDGDVVFNDANGTVVYRELNEAILDFASEKSNTSLNYIHF